MCILQLQNFSFQCQLSFLRIANAKKKFHLNWNSFFLLFVLHIQQNLCLQAAFVSKKSTACQNLTIITTHVCISLSCLTVHGGFPPHG
jgi:hypothetical protein